MALLALNRLISIRRERRRRRNKARSKRFPLGLSALHLSGALCVMCCSDFFWEIAASIFPEWKIGLVW
jgi:hypothetical protein